MRKQKIVTVLTYVLIIGLAVACIGLFLYQTANNNWKIDPSNAAKFGLILVGLGITTVKMITRTSGTSSLKQYASLYQKEVGAAFSTPDRKKEKRILLKGIACYHESRYQFFIPLEKLKNRDFTDVMFWWDCA